MSKMHFAYCNVRGSEEVIRAAVRSFGELFDAAQAQPVVEGKQYPAAPGYKKEGTSELAATSMRSRSNNLQEAVLNVLKRHPVTPDEAAMELAGSILAIRPRFSELVALGKIRETGERRVNQSGKLANVYELI